MNQPIYELSKYYNSVIRCLGLLLHAKPRGDKLHLTVAMLAIDTKFVLKSGDIYLYLAGKVYKTKTFKRIPINPFPFRIFSIGIPYKDLEEANIHSRLSLIYMDSEGRGFVKPVIYSLWPGMRGRGKIRALKIFTKTDTTVYVRQSLRNRVYITQRRRNISDSSRYRYRLNFAYYLALLLRWKEIILLYEKESMKYEESAAVLYEKLIDKGYKNTYFVLDASSPHNKYVDEKYQNNILKKHTFKHYLYFFLSNTFISTEMPGHAIDLRVANKHAIRKINSKRLRYVFLQHGVMYMVSLSSKARRPARKGGGGVPPNTKIVVSSELEARHFIEQGGYSREDLYITGLPKFDRAYRNKSANSIVVMPTWRPWEYNQIRIKPEESRYYKMLLDMVAGVPVKYRDRVHLLPHPLFIREVNNTELAEYIKPFDSYDEVLRDADVLVTDYSSIAYDAFYRGAKVIFWWKEKDYCMEKYGGDLMLDEKSVFGDVVFSRAKLKKAINNNYGENQNKEFRSRYEKIVGFKDGKNTERLIKLLVRDNIIVKRKK